MRIGIVGSMHHTEAMLAARDALCRLNHDAYLTSFASSFMGKTDGEKQQIKIHQKMRQDAIREFWNLMQDGNAILVMNLDRNGIKNYIGGNALMEIGFAHVLNQKIYLYNPIPDMSYCKSEIEAVQPVIINGDFSRIF